MFDTQNEQCSSGEHRKVGAADGTADGVAVVGVRVGTALGSAEGEDEGSAETMPTALMGNSKLLNWQWPMTAPEDGTALGALDGAADGKLDGAAEGSALGGIVGVSLGPIEGAAPREKAFTRKRMHCGQ